MFACVTEEWFVFSLLLKQTASRDFYDEIYSNCVFLIHELTIHIYVYVKDKGTLFQGESLSTQKFDFNTLLFISIRRQETRRTPILKTELLK